MSGAVIMNKNVNIITLGCSKNIVDSEKLARQLAAFGYNVVYDSNDFAEIIVLNTCGFIKDAKEESIDTILSAVQAKEAGKVEKVYVIGCLSERYADELRTEIPEVDKYFGAKGYVDILSELNIEAKNEILNERIVSTPNHVAYLKIAEGCNRTCAFCAIPLIKGAYNSFPEKDLLSEATFLAHSGVKEIMLIAQDLSYYGIDLSNKSELPSLVKKMLAIDKLEWLRLHYLYPNNFPLEILYIMAADKKLCNYVDIPFQHISDTVLSNMRRNFTRSKTYELLDIMKTKVPDIALRTTFLVGHPGETDKDFNELLKFVKDVEFDRLGVFTYSHEEHTYADKHYKDDIPEQLKQDRADELMQLQEHILMKKQQERIGKKLHVLIDRKEDDYFIGRSQYDSYEVDTEILIKSETAQVGNMYLIKIDEVNDLDLIGTLL